ncbi:MAG TPA: aminodeoxychorismate synthase component I [Lentisphaeria bacterium]|nr:MAG: aminodeoxychorismate synthase, component I [Lentisphaerae bacterium GWF2_38_69]HBM17015.1 aminodeoxychorismate synthase component I [Lentisphaeria bacterium]
MSARTVLCDRFTLNWMEFENPSEVLQTYKIDEVVNYLNYIESTVLEKKQFAVGFVSYDAAPAFDAAMELRSGTSKLPLLWFALFDSYKIIELPEYLKKNDYFSKWEPTVARKEYNSAIDKVKNYIQSGDTYQVNYTMRQHSEFKGDSWELFCELASSQRSPNCAYIETDDFTICSASPELFFTLKDGIITSMPMKGTAPRGLTLEEDKKQSEWLHHSHKNRSENIMIVDMIRNDIGRIAETGTVKIPKVFEVEKYPTVWQMTSTVQAKTKSSFVEIMKALFPCASITGAPKVRTMEIISELESTPRGIYTGCIGLIAPDKSAQFNVAIRTVVIDKKTSKAEYGVGGGIVWESTAIDEYEECLIKTKFLSNPIPCFSILESLLWTYEEGYFLQDYHIERMKKSAEYFDYPFDEDKIRSVLTEQNSPSIKIRILLNADGNVSFESVLLGKIKNEIRVAIASKPINKNNPFLYHKTTNRMIYDSIKSKYPDYDEVILWNQNGEITEGLSSNIIIRTGNRLFTPPISSGLLAGTFRQSLIDKGELKEKIITVEELKSADEVFLINSVCKFRKAIITK